MVKKKSAKKNKKGSEKYTKKQTCFQKEIKKFEKELGKEINDAEKWMHERRKFFIKLAWVAGFIAVLWIISSFI